MSLTRRTQRGQVLVMVTLVLIAMCGLMGLAVDLGWSYFVKRSAQAAADSAALVAAQVALATLGQAWPYNCGKANCVSVPTPCPTVIPQPPTTNIEAGCLYAAQNGLTVGGEGGRQNVLMQADVTAPPPTAPGVYPGYWVTVRTTQMVPQLFSAVLGNTVGMSSARATAGIVDSAVSGSLMLINRQNDCIPMNGGVKDVCGVDLLVQANDNQGQYALQADGGIRLASLDNGTNNPDGNYAGQNLGGGTVKAPSTWIRGAGSYQLQGSSSWDTLPVNRFPDGDPFRDPMRGKLQPPPPPRPDGATIREFPVANGVIQGSSDPSNPTQLTPGYYYAATQDNSGNWVASGNTIQINGSVYFTKGQRSFGEYVFFGGVKPTQQGQGDTTFKFDEGRYVIAGVKPASNGDPNPSFDIASNITITDGSTPFVPNSNAGEIFIFTDTSYVGYDWTTGSTVPLYLPSALTTVASSGKGNGAKSNGSSISTQLQFGTVGFQAGANVDVRLNLHGINRDSGSLPPDLKAFDASILLWQDQNNSVVKYYDDPSDPYNTINMPCIVGDTFCRNTRLASTKSPAMFFKASPGSSLYGVIYQPRGAWTNITGGSGYAGPLQIIAGAFNLEGNATLSLQGLDRPILRKMVALIE